MWIKSIGKLNRVIQIFFEFDYKQMSILRTEIFFQELMLKTWDRSRLCQCINMEDEIDIL